jgi:hypothetical protein
MLYSYSSLFTGPELIGLVSLLVSLGDLKGFMTEQSVIFYGTGIEGP